MQTTTEKAQVLEKALFSLGVVVSKEDCQRIVLSYDIIMEKGKSFSLADVEDIEKEFRELTKKKAKDKELQEP
jgi:hypothetical protein